MNPIPIAAYLEARGKTRERRDEQLRAMAMQSMQQQLAMAQQGADLRDRAFNRDLQVKQFDQQKILNDLQVKEAERLGKMNPVKDKATFIQPLLDPYNAYTAAATAYADYMKPGAVKFRPSSEIRQYADALRKARASALAARTSIGKLAASVGMEGISPELLESDYPIADLPLLSSSAAVPTSAPRTSALGVSKDPIFTGKPSRPSIGQIGIPPPPPPDERSTDRVVPQGVPVPPRKYSGPPIQVAPFKSTILNFKSLLEPLKMAEDNLAYSDLYEPQQKQADTVATEMFANAMETFVPKTWNRLASGRDHAEMNAADFAEFGLNPEHVTSLLARHAHGDAMQMKSVILERYLSMFNQYNMPSKLTERFIKSAKDKADLDEAADRLLTTKQARDINAAQEGRAIATHKVAMKSANIDADVKAATKETVILKLKQDYENAKKEGLRLDSQLKKIEEATKRGTVPIWASILGKANDFWTKMFDNRIGASIKLASDILKNRRNTMLENGENIAGIDASMNKLSRLQNMLTGPTTDFLKAHQNNDPRLLSIVNNHKKSMYDIVKDDPNLKDYFAALGGTMMSGSPGEN